LEQGHSPKDQRAHNPLAEIGLGDQQGRQSLRGYKQRLDLTLGRGVDQCDPTGKQTDFAEELPDSQLGDRRCMTQAVALGDSDSAAQHHKRAGHRHSCL
jgi:hypothetical protein